MRKGLFWGEAAEQKPLQGPRVFVLDILFERLPYFRNFGSIDPLTFESSQVFIKFNSRGTNGTGKNFFLTYFLPI